MKKLIYKTLTVQNGIIMSGDALDYLSKCVSADDIPAIAAEMKRHGASIIGLEAAKDVMFRVLDTQNGTLSAKLLEVRNVAYKRRDGVSRLKFLRGYVQEVPQPVYSLREGGEAVIFGAYHRNSLGEEVLEDDQGVVKVDFSRCESEAFLCENVFVGLSGFLKQGVFRVSAIFHPYIEREANTGVRKPEYSFLVFRSLEWNTHMVEKLRSIIDSMSNVVFVVFVGQPDASSHVSDTLKAYKNITFIFVPSSCDRSMALLPKTLDYVYTDYNYRPATNPVEIHVEDRRIGVVADSVFEVKARGRYIGASHLQSLVRTFLSQYSFNPFSGGNMCLSGRMDLMIVVQSSLSCVLEVHGTTFVSLGKSENSLFYLKYCCGDVSLAEI